MNADALLAGMVFAVHISRNRRDRDRGFRMRRLKGNDSGLGDSHSDGGGDRHLPLADRCQLRVAAEKRSPASG